MPGRKRKLGDGYVPEPWFSEDEHDLEEPNRLHHVPPVPMHYLSRDARQLPTVNFGTLQRQRHRQRQQEQQEVQQEQPQQPPQEEQPQHRPQEEQPQQPPQEEHLQQSSQEELQEDQPTTEQQHPPHELEDEVEIDDVDMISINSDMFGEQQMDIEDNEEVEDEHEQQQDEDHDVQDNDDDDDGDDVLTYQCLYAKLKEDWLITEIDHCVSKTASNAFWELASKRFPPLYAAKEREGKKKIPQFKQARQSLYNSKVPPITLEVAYIHKASREITVRTGTSTPSSQFPPNVYSKLYEAASVKVMSISFVRSSVRASVRPSVRLSVCQCACMHACMHVEYVYVFTD